MVVRTATPTRAASWAALFSGPRISPGNNVGIEAKGDVQQCDLVDALPLVLAVAGLGVDDGVDHPPVLFPDELKLTGAVLDGEDPLAVQGWWIGASPPP